MSEMFDVNAAVYPFPPKPVPLDVAEKPLSREDQNPAQAAQCGDGRPLLYRSGNSGAGGRNRRLRGGFAGNGALRQRPSGFHAVGGRRALHGETAKILSPEKQVLMPTLFAECSLDLGCPEEEFHAFCDSHPDRTVVVYANTSAAVKARADWVVTSSIAVELIEHRQPGREDHLGAGSPSRQLRAEADRRRRAVLARCLHCP